MKHKLWLTKLSYDADREISVFLTSPLRCCVYLCENVYAVPSEVLQIVPDATVPQLSKFLNSHVQRKRVFVKRLNLWRVITWYGRARPWKKACKIWCSMFTFILFIRYRFPFFSSLWIFSIIRWIHNDVITRKKVLWFSETLHYKLLPSERSCKKNFCR